MASLNRSLWFSSLAPTLFFLGQPLVAADLPPAGAATAHVPVPDGNNWAFIYQVSLCQQLLHPDDPQWKQYADYALSQLPAPRLPLSVAQLPPAAQKRLKEAFALVGKVAALPQEQRAAEAAPVLKEVKRLVAEYPDLTGGWVMLAHLCLMADRSLEGGIAASNLNDLRAWQSGQPETLALLHQLMLREWTPSPWLAPADREEFSTLMKEALVLEMKNAAPEARAEQLKRIKLFNLNHPENPYGWVLLHEIARKLGRNLDRDIAWGKLHPTPASPKPAILSLPKMAPSTPPPPPPNPASSGIPIAFTPVSPPPVAQETKTPVAPPAQPGMTAEQFNALLQRMAAADPLATATKLSSHQEILIGLSEMMLEAELVADSAYLTQARLDLALKRIDETAQAADLLLARLGSLPLPTREKQLEIKNVVKGATENFMEKRIAFRTFYFSWRSTQPESRQKELKAVETQADAHVEKVFERIGPKIVEACKKTLPALVE